MRPRTTLRRLRSRTAELEAGLRECQKINQDLRESEFNFRDLVSNCLVGIGILEDGRLTYTNLRLNEIFGCSAEEMLGRPLLDLPIEEDRWILEENIRKRLAGKTDSVAYSYRSRRKDGCIIHVEVRSNVMKFRGRLAMVGMVMDITERVHAERELLALQQKLFMQSIRDPLTGLYNRRYLDETLERELTGARRHKQPLSIILADLDRFKCINDHYGHLGGDEVLRAFAELIQRHVRKSDIACRYGGEEFLLALTHTSAGNAVERAEAIRCALASLPIPFGATRIPVTVSIGIATFPEHGESYAELLSIADSALYRSKSAGRNRVTLSLCTVDPLIAVSA